MKPNMLGFSEVKYIMQANYQLFSAIAITPILLLFNIAPSFANIGKTTNFSYDSSFQSVQTSQVKLVAVNTDDKQGFPNLSQEAKTSPLSNIDQESIFSVSQSTPETSGARGGKTRNCRKTGVC